MQDCSQHPRFDLCASPVPRRAGASISFQHPVATSTLKPDDSNAAASCWICPPLLWNVKRPKALGAASPLTPPGSPQATASIVHRSGRDRSISGFSPDAGNTSFLRKCPEEGENGVFMIQVANSYTSGCLRFCFLPASAPGTESASHSCCRCHQASTKFTERYGGSVRHCQGCQAAAPTGSPRTSVWQSEPAVTPCPRGMIQGL